ncbi:amylo-alpha-1,6-glucosidase, partial [Solicola sp. PLA-1-18]|uniref:amylo-alpha-1,6-glucosidase n=1 Tax=Solicola sp. PLA-1-18 TaxID=3380532 RepID=UPI003B7BB0ED
LGAYPALALDAHKQRVDGVASNMGHLLGTGLLTEEETATVAARLLHPTMFSGHGIRTLSSDNGGYWPWRYHCGSVWTHDTAVVVDGLRRTGHTDAAATVARGLLRAAEGFDHRMPELFAGLDDTVFPPSPYPASCRPQAWAAASVVPVARALGAL